MQIYLIRHAHAVEGKDDAARALSGKGRAQIRALARFLRGNDALGTHEFWHSPLVRSVDTARRLAKHLKVPGTFTLVSGLLHDDDPAIIAKKINARKQAVAVVGHEPHLSALASLLVFGRPKPPRFILKKGAVLALELEGRRWAVRWQVSPDLLPD